MAINLNHYSNTISSEGTSSNIDIDLNPKGTGSIDVNTSKIINVTNPTSAQDAATKAYVDANAGGIASVVADTSPQLGGNLDTNTKHINVGYSSGSSDDRIRFNSTNMQIYYGAVGSSSHGVISTSYLDICRNVTNPGLGDVVFAHDVLNSTLNIYGNQYSGSTNGTLRLYHNNRSNYITITPPYHNQTSYTLTLPTGAGTNGQVLTTNGYGDLSWTTPTATVPRKLVGKTEDSDVATVSGPGRNINFTLYGLHKWDIPANANVLATGPITASSATNEVQSTTLMVRCHSTSTISLPTTTWVGGSAPTVSATDFSVIEFWYLNNTLYGAYVGDVS